MTARRISADVTDTTIEREHQPLLIRGRAHHERIVLAAQSLAENGLDVMATVAEE